MFDVKPKPVGRQPRPDMVEMIATVRSIKTEQDVYEVLLTGDEKPATVRQQIKRAARTVGVELAVVRSPHGWYVGLMTPARAPGRRRSGTAA